MEVVHTIAQRTFLTVASQTVSVHTSTIIRMLIRLVAKVSNIIVKVGPTLLLQGVSKCRFRSGIRIHVSYVRITLLGPD